jgi:Ca2+-binding EF-hand superfamily protein
MSTIKGVGSTNAQAPRGLPPGAGPVGTFKPPPLAPPPRSLMQTTKKPAVEAIKPIQLSRTPTGAMTPTVGGANSTIGIPGRGPPPRGLAPDMNGESDFVPDSVKDSSNNMAAAKLSKGDRQPAAARKAGAISMFEEPPPQEPAEKKLKDPVGKPVLAINPGRGGPRPGPPPRPTKPQGIMADPSAPMFRTPRPLPPNAQPPGIPEGQPLPPGNKPNTSTGPSAPLRQVPERSRAPPRVDPNASRFIPDPEPPQGIDPPYMRGKKDLVKEEAYVKRRERDNPEFESSSSDEEIDKKTNTAKRTFIKQPAKPAQIDTEKLILDGLPDPEGEEVEGPPPYIIPPRGEEKQRIKDLNNEKRLADVAASRPTTAIKNEEEEEEKVDGNVYTDAVVADNTVVTMDTEVKLPPSKAGFIPPPPIDLDATVDSSKLGRSLPRGRLSVRCIEGIEIKKKNDPNPKPRTDPFIKFKLGAAERHPWKQTKVAHKQDNFPKFGGEVIYFDVVEPLNFVFKEDLAIQIECLNKSAMKDEPLGSVTMSVVRFFKTPYIQFEERVPIYFAGQKNSLSKLLLEFCFEEAKPGIFHLTLYEAVGLRNIDPMGNQSPCIQFTLGDQYKKRSKTITSGGVAPYFAEESILLWADHDNWVNNLKVDIIDESIGEEFPIGSTNFSLLPYMKSKPDDAEQDTFDIFHTFQIDPKDDRVKEERKCGELMMRVQYLTCGTLTVHMDKAKGLQFPENYVLEGGTRMDPYAKLHIEGKAIDFTKRTPADKDGGEEPVWDHTIKLDIVDQYMMSVDVWNQGLSGNDTLLGNINISLLSVYRNGNVAQWYTIKQRKQNGGIREVGEIYISLNFVGPIGMAYPQFRPDIDSFDDTYRRDEKKIEIDDDEEIKIKKEIDTTPDLEEDKKEKLAKESLKKKAEEIAIIKPIAEFTEEEIVAAFKFIDLDHNNYVGAKEIRHILICMGEMITDEEIDCMISMVDLDGDGQISFTEFRILVLDPNPGKKDMIQQVNAGKEELVLEDKMINAGILKSNDLTAYQRQKEMTQRESKKNMLVSFVADNEVTIDYIKSSYQAFLFLPKSRRMGGRIKFPDYCEVLQVEPIQEYQRLHSLFDSEELGDLDFREFLLSMLNFIPVDREIRIRFSFLMFDELQTGYISQKEVEEILRGNHMISLASVQRKAETIMKQASKNKNGTITSNEFVVVSKKFPNILLPSVGVKLSNPSL